ncbi:DNA primase large subunit isoform X2 [Zonotrichia albicollis]|uniref:DNA primase large subunit isoform X2 n=1 Tax=Zonotrichia albicollis TaxID=44394 RepID=UPI000EAB0440|nr:DNA primase large subunit isoform X3 [Zonotrichia albicollis]
MEFSSRGRQRHARLAGDRREQYPHSLQFYLEPPTESISLVEFESFAVDRLRLLKVVENLGVSYVRSSEAYKTKLEAELRKLKFPYKALAEDDYEARRKDHISHFILRLAYCQSEDLRRWFLQQEMDLFRYRFNELTENLMQKFLEHVNLSFEANLYNLLTVKMWLLAVETTAHYSDLGTLCIVPFLNTDFWKTMWKRKISAFSEYL